MRQAKVERHRVVRGGERQSASHGPRDAIDRLMEGLEHVGELDQHAALDGSEYATVRSHAVQLMSSGSNACWLGCSNAAAITGITRGTSIKLDSSLPSRGRTSHVQE